jgi:hypothetical protein
VGLPARIGRLEPLRKVGSDVQPAVPGATAEPLHRAAYGEIDPESGDVERNDPRRLVAVEDHVRADLVSPTDDRLDFLDLGLLEDHMADRDEERSLVDPLHDLHVVLADDHLEIRLRLVEVAHRREVPALVDDTVPRRVDRPEARKRDRLGNSDVLVHHSGARRRADDAADLVADAHRRLPPALGPGADTALRPHARVLRKTLRGLPRHRAERVVREVGRLREDRELVAVVG